jgi:predicted acylesterase/phospholipase RssA
MHVVLLLSLLWSSALAAQQGCPAGPTALVLSGGGAKGLAHIGVIQALEARGIRPDLVVGTSMGALVGALYASGASGAELEQLARQSPLAGLFRANEPRGPASWGNRLPLVIWEEGERGFAMQGATIRQASVNALLNAMLLRGNLQARGDFDRLPIPLRVVATNLTDRSVVVLDGGDLAQAVRASIAIPLVFTPEPIDDLVLTDGGLSANIPVNVARRTGAARVIVSDATELPDDSLDITAPLDVAERLLDWLFHQPLDSLRPDDLGVRAPVDGFSALDFSRRAIDSLIRIGRQAAEPMIDAWRCTPPSGTALPPLSRGPIPSLRGIDGDTSDPDGIRIIRRALSPERNQPIDVADLADRLTDLGEDEVFREVWLRPTGQADTVRFHPVMRRLSRRVAGIGLSYDGQLGGRAWAGYVDRSVPLLRGEATALLTVSRFDNTFSLELRRHTLLGQRNFTPVATVHLGEGDRRRFLESGLELPENDYRFATAAVGLERDLAFGLRLTVSGVAATWRELDKITQADLIASAVGGQVALRRVSDDRASKIDASAVLTTKYARASIEMRALQRLGAFTLEETVRAGIGRDLPTWNAFSLGGTAGFPGLRIGERPGDNELFTAVTISRHLFGPLSFRLTGAFGRAAYDATSFRELDDPAGQLSPGFFIPGAFLSRGGWLLGGRAGIGSDTPLGPIRLEWGTNDLGRGEVFLRVGRWE